eukprot:m.3577 g.3577  ORF g.3577 m.3577 type:complete len:949 (+) comp9571_c0_seq2:58-2904(+)
MTEPPKVTGLSPNSATPGTRITIRGQNLGQSAQDLIGVTICGYDCLIWADWKSSSKILCRTGAGKGRGEVIVTTKSGGVGTCTVNFSGYIAEIGPLQESAVWIDEPDIAEGSDKVQMLKRRDPLGFDQVLDLPSTEDELEEIYPEGSGEITAENFVPAWYLLEYHRNTTFQDIKKGLEHLSNEVADRKRGPIAFVKRNINTFLLCYDTLNDVNQMLLRSESTSEGGTITERLERLVKEASKTADSLFADVLQRKEKADATRNALSVLQRYRFLFSLPQTLERNIQNEEYDMVINGYESAKALFAGTEVQAFKRVLEEVENLVGKCRDMLKLKLQENPAKLDDRKKLIRHLSQLNTEGDPAWDCLMSQYQWIIKRIEKCKSDHQTGLDGLPLVTAIGADGEVQSSYAHSRKFSVTSSGGSGSESHSPQRMLSFQGGSFSLGKAGSNLWSRRETGAPKAVHFVEELCDLMMKQENSHDLWQLALAYFSGKLVQWPAVVPQEEEEEHRKREKDFQEKLVSMLGLFSDLLRVTFFPDQHGSLGELRMVRIGSWTPFEAIKQGVGDAWMPFCLRLVRSSFSALSQLQLPLGTLTSVEKLAFDLRMHCLRRMFEKAKRDIQGLKAREDWRTEADDCGCITSLPVLFENICVESLLSVKEIVTEAKPGESHHASYLEPLRTETAQLLSECFEVFADVFDNLALYQEFSLPSQKRHSGPTPYIVFRSTESLDDLDEDDYMPTREKQLLIVMSNGLYTRNKVIPKIIEYYRSHSYPDWKSVRQAANEILERIDSKLHDIYIESKELPIVGALEPGFVVGDWDWEECPTPKDVRGYLKEALLKLVKVHAEVYSVAPSLLPQVFVKLIDGVVDEMCRLVGCIEAFSQNGVAQARLELTVLQSFLVKHGSAEAKSKLDAALGYVGILEDLNRQKEVDHLVSKFKQRSKFHFASLLEADVK